MLQSTGSQRVRYGVATEQQQQENKLKREDGKVVVAVRHHRQRPVCVRVCLCVFRGTGWARAKAAVLLLFRTSLWEGYVTARQGLC